MLFKTTTTTTAEKKRASGFASAMLLRVLNVCFVCVIWDLDCSSVNKILHFMYDSK